MFSRATLTSRPVLASATVLGAGAAAYYLSRPSPIQFESSYKMEKAGFAPDTKAAPKRTFTVPLFSHQLKVKTVEQVNHDTKRITFELPNKDEVCGCTPSAAILTQHWPAGGWLPVFRPYTPVNDLDEPGVLQLLVKKYPNGKASTYMHSLEPGSSLTVRGPLPGYSYKPSTTPRDVLLVAGGAGITPIYSLTKGILTNPSDKTRIELVWGVNGTRDIILRSELEELEQKYPERLRVTYAVSGAESKPEAPSLGDEEKWKKGYVNKSVLQEVIARCEKGSWGDEKGTKVIMCGPPSMEEAIAGKKAGILGELGVDKGKIYRF